MFFNSFSKRNFYTQTGAFSFGFDLQIDSLSGSVEIGFSGFNKTNWSFLSGKIYDFNNNFVGTYDNNPTTISGTISSQTVDYYINGYPVAFGEKRPTGFLDYFYINPINNNAVMDLIINGTMPNYTITSFIPFNSNSSILTGQITNNSLPFKIFSGSFLGDTSKANLSGVPTGIITGTVPFYITQTGITGNTTFPISFYTNFGIITPSISGVGTPNLENAFFLQAVGNPNVTNNGSTIYICSFYNPTGDMNIFPSLSLVSGAGNISGLVPMTGFYSGILTGNIIGSGNVSKFFNVTGSGLGGTGFISDTITNFQYATGMQSFFYSIPATGIGATGEFTGIATGNITGIITGIIPSENGIISLSGLFSGTPIVSIAPNTGYITATGSIILNSPRNGDTIYVNGPTNSLVYGSNFSTVAELSNLLNSNPNKYSVTTTYAANSIFVSAIQSGVLGNAVSMILPAHDSSGITVSSTGLQGGQDLGINTVVTANSQFSGYLNNIFTGSGTYSKFVTGTIVGIASGLVGTKTFTGTWDFKTGLSSTLLTSYRDNQFISGNKYIGGVFDKSFGSIYLSINYSTFSVGQDIVKLTITGLGLGTGFSENIIGG